jgi:tetratricopeptide (TPR) repeat protein
MTHRKFRFMLWLACTLGTLPGWVHAADTTPPAAATPAADALATPRALIAEGKWREAIDALRSVNDTASADWNNLMGYAQRKAAAPDYALAERYYDAALKIDPKHRGALEYSGELYLLRGDLARAEARVQELGRACFFGCKELDQLRAAVAAFKANGNKFVAQKK